MVKSNSMQPVYVQYGCAYSVAEGWLNFDSSPTLTLERVPFVGRFISHRFSGNTRRFPSRVQYGDICKGLPVPLGTTRGVYASHVLEHLSLDDLRQALINTFKMLAPGGIFRLIVPDLQERAKRYVEEAAKESPDAASVFLRATGMGQERRPRTLIQHARQMFGGSKHLWMWDEYSMAAELKRANFVRIRRCEFGDSTDPMFSRIEEWDRFFDKELQIRECALEALRPE